MKNDLNKSNSVKKNLFFQSPIQASSESKCVIISPNDSKFGFKDHTDDVMEVSKFEDKSSDEDKENKFQPKQPQDPDPKSLMEMQTLI